MYSLESVVRAISSPPNKQITARGDTGILFVCAVDPTGPVENQRLDNQND